MASSKSKPFLFFFLATIAVSVFMFGLEWHRSRTPRLAVPGNAGIGSLFTVDGRLTAVYQDGRTCTWDWDVPQIKQADFRAGSGRAIPLEGTHFATVARAGDRFLLSVFDIDTARRVKELTVGWDDQDIHIRNAHNRQTPTLIRRNPERDGAVEYEFVRVDLDAEILRPAVVRTLTAGAQTLRDFAVCDSEVLYAAGADEGQAHLLAIDLYTGQTRWEQRWADTVELTSTALSMDGKTVWAGDRDGNLLKIAAQDGRLLDKVTLLRPGETRPTTNDYSVLNLVADPSGRLLSGTIAPTAYTVDAETGQVVRRLSGHRVVSKVAFSPDGRKTATADLRADGVIMIFTLE